MEKVYAFHRPHLPQKKEGVIMPENSKVSKAQQKAVNKYVKNNYDRINVTFPKGHKEILKKHASQYGESVNGFINRAINETMERDGSTPAAPQSLAVKETAPKPQPKTPGLPSFLTPDVLEHIDAKRFLSSDLGYQLQIGDIIGMENLSSLAEYLKKNTPEPNTDE